MKHASLVIIGDEILSGRTEDKNLSYLAKWLGRLGINLSEVRVVLDDEDGEVLGDYVLDGDQIVVQLFLPTSAGDIDGKDDELPHGWEKDIPAMIGLKPEWVDDVEWMTGE